MKDATLWAFSAANGGGGLWLEGRGAHVVLICFVKKNGFCTIEARILDQGRLTYCAAFSLTLGLGLVYFPLTRHGLLGVLSSPHLFKKAERKNYTKNMSAGLERARGARGPRSRAMAASMVIIARAAACDGGTVECGTCDSEVSSIARIHASSAVHACRYASNFIS